MLFDLQKLFLYSVVHFVCLCSRLCQILCSICFRYVLVIKAVPSLHCGVGFGVTSASHRESLFPVSRGMFTVDVLLQLFVFCKEFIPLPQS